MRYHGDRAQVPNDLVHVCERVQEKVVSYERYNFSAKFNDFLKAFFDLAQEYDSLEDFYRICVTIPAEMLGISSSLYLCRGEEQQLYHVCSSEVGVFEAPKPALYPIQLHNSPYEMERSYVIPVCSKQPYVSDELKRTRKKPSHQKSLWSGDDEFCGRGRTLGMYEIRMPSLLSEEDKFFFVKYANRIGYNLDNRLISIQNIEHLKFINTLVMDIEHNVIVPNMFFRHLFNRLNKKITVLESIKDDFHQQSTEQVSAQAYRQCADKLEKVHGDLLEYHQEIVRHHTNISMFLESLFRREHFERGHLVLHPQRCFVEKEVITPQLENYTSRLKAAKVTVDRPHNMLEEEFQLLVDIGLLAQVYANLFSNAAKYTREIIDHRGMPRKAMAYGREIVDNFPEKGKKGIKFNVFTTGPCMTKAAGMILFAEGTRGEGNQTIPGSGHGLSFIRHVVEMHGGEVGYEPTLEGNNFYFILPIPPLPYPPALLDAVK